MEKPLSNRSGPDVPGSPGTSDLVAKEVADRDSRESPAKVLLRNFFSVMNAMGDEAQENYERALAELRKHREDVLIEIIRSDQACDPNDYSTRWALVHAATEMKHPSALPFLRNIVLTPIPPERSTDPHSFSTVAEETILRTTAVDGVKYLAVDRNSAALESLFEFLGIPSLSIRRASVQAILAVRKDKKTRRAVSELLPKDMRFLTDLKPRNVRDVRQIRQPQRHLRRAERREQKRQMPRLLSPGVQEGRVAKPPPGGGKQ